jgi:hypothetical protein
VDAITLAPQVVPNLHLSRLQDLIRVQMPPKQAAAFQTIALHQQVRRLVVAGDRLIHTQDRRHLPTHRLSLLDLVAMVLTVFILTDGAQDHRWTTDIPQLPIISKHLRMLTPIDAEA